MDIELVLCKGRVRFTMNDQVIWKVKHFLSAT